jgi:hypothetical protein
VFKRARNRVDPQQVAAAAAARQQRISRFRDALDGHEASGVFALGEPPTPADPTTVQVEARNDRS